MVKISRSHFSKSISSLVANTWDFLPPTVTETGAEAANGFVAHGLISSLSAFDLDPTTVDTYLAVSWVFVVADIVVASTYSTSIDSNNDLSGVKREVVRCLAEILPLSESAKWAVLDYNFLVFNACERANNTLNQ